jgi:anti-anti-sigma factor
VHVSVSGELDAHHGQLLHDELVHHLDAGRDAIRIDVTDLSFIDSSGLRVLLQAEERCRAAGGSLTLHGPGAQVRYILEITDLHGRFGVEL